MPKPHLHAAISFNSIAFNGAALFGPSLTGVLVPLIGFAGCFYVNAISFVAVFIALALMEFPPHTAAGADLDASGPLGGASRSSGTTR